jgi:hypothetical protein
MTKTEHFKCRRCDYDQFHLDPNTMTAKCSYCHQIIPSIEIIRAIQNAQNGDEATPDVWRILEQIINTCRQLPEPIPVALNGDMYGMTTHPIHKGHIILLQRSNDL